ncbi:hypothetical protein IEQ34_005991 [Dendrobium chrysotoxum]|uniref:Uncharacterized protein n=1 Tax=Dendrobium chrysotoxum TaxID=161865 RepID=A0AAV7HEJ3_DENCH|nr:hypothetical protein IEQ34_005991 [Dendrobium chrysotoxum]
MAIFTNPEALHYANGAPCCHVHEAEGHSKLLAVQLTTNVNNLMVKAVISYKFMHLSINFNAAPTWFLHLTPISYSAPQFSHFLPSASCRIQPAIRITHETSFGCGISSNSLRATSIFPCFAYPLIRLVQEMLSFSGICSNALCAEYSRPNSECMFTRELATKRSNANPDFSAMACEASPANGEGSRQQEVPICRCLTDYVLVEPKEDPLLSMNSSFEGIAQELEGA